MSDFRTLTDDFIASPQIAVADLIEAKRRGVTCVINNRPDGEAPDEPQSADIEAAAKELDLDYRYIPVGHAGFSLQQVEALADALEQAEGKVLGYCRSGTRSTLLWAMAQAKRGESPDAVAEAAAGGGYDVSPVRATMDALEAQDR